MKQASFKKNMAWLRICIMAFVLAVLSLFLFSFTVSSKLADDIWKQLGITEKQGTEKIRTSFLGNYFDYYGVRNIKNIASGNKAALAKDLLSFTKEYVNSAEFKKEYELMRSQAKPVEPTATVKTKEEIRKEKIAETQKSIKQMEESMKTMDAEMKKIMQSGLDMQKGMLKEYQDPNSKMIDLFYQGEVMTHENNARRYNEDLEKWDTNYPADYKEVIKERLQKYLTIAATVDFNAELVEKNGKKYFVKREYEGKSADWKMIYRAGKDVYEVAKPFAEAWVKSL